MQEHFVNEGFIIVVTQFWVIITRNYRELKRSGPEIELWRPRDKQNVEPPCKQQDNSDYEISHL
jgi:hypothetical protein